MTTPDTWEERLHQERQTWLREEIVKLEGMKQSVISHGHKENDNRTCDVCGWNSALQAIIDRYQSQIKASITKQLEK